MGCLLALGGGAGYAARRSRPSLIAGFTLGSAFAACGMAIGTPHSPSAAHPACCSRLASGWASERVALQAPRRRPSRAADTSPQRCSPA